MVAAAHSAPLSRCARGLAVAVLGVSATAFGNVGAREASPTHPLTVEDYLATRSVSRVALSPDGRHILIVAQGKSVVTNTPSLDVYLKDTSPHSKLQPLPPTAAQAVWRADSQALTILMPVGKDCTQLWRIPITTRQPAAESQTCLEPTGRIFPTYSWSADGRFLAYLANSSPSDEFTKSVARATALPAQQEVPQKCVDLDTPEARALGMDALDRACTGTSVGTEWMWGVDVASPALRAYHAQKAVARPTELWIFESATGLARRVSNTSTDVRKFDWSGSGHRLAWLTVAADAQQDPMFGGGPELFAGAGTLHMADAVETAGLESVDVGQLSSADLWMAGLRWSPDGERIAISTGSSIRTYAASANGPSHQIMEGPSWQIDWSPDSRSLYVLRSVEQRQTLLQLNADSGEIQPATDEIRRWHGKPSFSADHQTFALTLEDVTEPTRVYLGHVGSARVTEVAGFQDLNPHWLHVSPLLRGDVRWRSFDDKYDLYGVTIAAKEKNTNIVRPMIVTLLGAGMPTLLQFGMDDQQPILLLAAQGYTVFIPNSRGRYGFGPKGYQGLAEEHTYYSKPWMDVMQGINTAVALGVADATRMGIMGESYGGGLAGYGIAHNDQFRAAVLKEPVSLNLATAWRGIWGDPHFGKHMSKDYGFDNPYIGSGKAFVDEESPMTHVDAVRTPTLLEFGVKSGSAFSGGNEFYHAMHWFGVEADLRMYPRTVHGFVEPKLVADAFQHEIDWIERYLPR